MSARARARKKQKGHLSYLWIILWAVGSILPFIPYSQPLWLASWSDNPYAYLVWVPVFAFVWAGWSIWRDYVNKDDPELSYLLALIVMALCGSIIVVGRVRWDLTFVGHSVGLLFWPVWALGLAWWLFGIGVTRLIWKPLLYLLLSWPAFYSDIVHITNPILDAIANSSVRMLSSVFHWLQVSPVVGTYTVLHQGVKTVVHVTSVCNGADSFLAMIILFPIVMVSYSKGFGKKLFLLILAAVLAIFANVVRLWLILMALHWTGSRFALGILHPVLGVILFLVMFGIIVWLANLLNLKSVGFARKDGTLKRPGWLSLGTSVVTIVLVTVLLWPMMANTPGTPANPKPITSDVLTKIMPEVPDWSRTVIGKYDESATLGPGAKSTAIAYTTVQGDYALAEMWWTYHPFVLKGYGVQNCLLFHGSKLIDSQQFNVSKGVTATLYAVYLPATKVGGTRAIYLDTVYSYSGKYQGKTVYIRMETATPVMLNATANTQTTQAVKKLVGELLNPKYDKVRHLAPVSINQTVHLHNYFSFIKQVSSKLL